MEAPDSVVDSPAELADGSNHTAVEDVFVFPTTLPQQRFWLLDKLEPGNPALNVPLFARLSGRLDRTILERALNEIVRRHEILRTSFRTEDGEPVQVIHGERTIKMRYWDICEVAASQREARINQLTLEEGARPFRLSEAPLIRAGLIKVDETEHVIMLTMHHICCDGWSNGLVIRELAQGYSALLLGGTGLPDLPLQYADFAKWQAEWLESPAAQEQRSFWKGRLSGIISPLNLPTDRPRGAIRSHSAAIETLLLPGPLVAAIKSVCGREDITPFMLFFATFGLLLYRYSGKPDFVIGSPAANRIQTDLEDLVGLFSNPLPLRLDLRGNPTFREFLQQVKDLALGGFANQSYPFEKIVEDIQTDPARSGTHWLQNYFIFQKAFMVPQKMPDLTLNPCRSVTPGAMFEWSLGVLERTEGVRLQLEYNTDLYNKGTVARVLQHFQHVLELAVRDLDLRVDQFPVMPQDEYQRLVEDWNRTTFSMPSERGVHELFEERVRQHPDAIAIRSREAQINYFELNSRANRVANYLVSLGVRQQERVGLAVDTGTLGYIVGLLAILKAGACAVELDVGIGAASLSKFILESRPAILLIDSKFPAELTPEIRMVNLEEDAKVIARQSPTDFPGSGLLLDQSAWVKFPKQSADSSTGAVFSHRSITNSAWVISSELSLNEQDSVAYSPDLVLSALLSGASLVFAENSKSFEPECWLNWVSSQKVTVAALTTSRWEQVVREFAGTARLSASCLRLLLVGGGSISPAVQQAWFAASANRIELVDTFVAFGAIGFLSFTRVKPGPQGDGRITITRPAANSTLHVLDENMVPVPEGVPGNIYASGSSLAMGSLRGAEADFLYDRFAGRPGHRMLKTGIRGRFLPARGIEIVGSAADLARTNGFRLELFEIWSQLCLHPAVWSALIVPFERSGERPTVAYVVAKGKNSADDKELRDFLGKRLPRYMVPVAVVVLEKFPLNEAGLIDLDCLPVPESLATKTGQMSDDKPSRKFLQESAQTPLAKALVRIWSDVLGVKGVGVYDNFFESGGDSLLAFRMVSRIQRDLNVDVPVATLFRHPTILQLVEALPEQNTKARTPELIRLQASNNGPNVFFLIGEGSFELFNLIKLLGKGMTIFASMTPLAKELIEGAVKRKFSKPPCLEELARAHVHQIQKQNTAGPTVLTGYCYSGLLAYEVARQLIESGTRVDAVMMLDTWMVRPSKFWRTKTYIKGHLRNLMRQGPMYLWRKGRTRVILEGNNLTATIQMAIRGDYSTNVPWHIIERIYTHAMFSYEPRSLPTRGVQLISRGTWFSNEFRKRDDTLGAAGFFANGLDVISVPGDHITVLNENNLKGLADCYRMAMEKLGLL